MTDPLVSTIIPNYNYGHFLRATIESALAQSYCNQEIIVVDDGSKDNSYDVIKSFGDQIKTVFKENGGMSSALNAGLRVSRGDWIALLDADDLWLPNKLDTVVRFAKANRAATLIYHKMRWVSEEGKVFGQPWPYAAPQGRFADKVINSGGWWRHPPTTGLTFSRRFLESITPFPEAEYRRAGEFFAASLAPLIGEIVVCRDALGLYRIHSSNDHQSWDSITHCTFFEAHAARQNEALENFRLTPHVNLKNHWPYQYHKWKLGHRGSLADLSWHAIRFPSASLLSRFRNLYYLWRDVVQKKYKSARFSPV